MVSQRQLSKAVDWLDAHALTIKNVAVVREDGICRFVATIYKMERLNKPSVYYCVDHIWLKSVTRVKRFCNY